MKVLLSSLFHRLAVGLLRHRLLSVVGFIGLSLGLLGGALQLRVDFSARAFFGSDAPSLRDLDSFRRAWGPDDGAILVAAEAEGGTVLTKERLEGLAALAGHLEAVEGVRRVTGIWNLPLPLDEGGTLAFRSAMERVRARPGDQERIARELTSDPLLVPLVVSKDGRYAAVAVELGVNPDDIGAVRPLVRQVEDVVRSAQGQHGLRYHLAGQPVVRAGLLELILGDQTLFVPISFVVMALLLALLFRRFHGVFLPLLSAALPSAFVMGVMGYLGEPIGVVNQVYFTLLPVIAVSGGVHFLSRYYEEAHHLGASHATLLPNDKESAVVNAVRFVGGACLFSSLTTVIGLLSLQLSDMHVLRSFGLYSAVGVSLAFVTQIVLVPLILSVTRGRVLDPDLDKREALISRVLGRMADLSLRHPRACIAGGVVVLGLGAWQGQHVVVDNTLTGMLRDDHPACQANRVVDEQLSGVISLEVDVRGPTGALDDPALLAALDEVEQRVRGYAGVRAVQGPPDVVRRANRAVAGDDRLPAEREVAAQLAFLAGDSDVFRQFLNDERSRGRMMIRTADMGGAAFSELEAKVRDDLGKAFEARGLQNKGASFVVTGTAAASYHGVNRLAEDLRWSILTAFVIIFGVIVVIFRSLRIGLLAVLPNAVPLVLGYGLLGLLGWRLEPGPAVVFTVALGIAVDDTIHLLARTMEEQSQGRSLEEAVREAIVRSGRPVIITTVILAAGFGVNALSHFPTNARVGALGAFVLLCALLGDLFVLPAMLVLFGKRKR